MKAGLTIVLLLAAASLWAQAESKNSANASLVYVEGSVLVNGKAAKIGDPIKSGDSIATGKAAAAEVVFGEKNIIRLREYTTAVMNLDQLQKEVQLQRGALVGVLKKLDKVAGVGMTVRSPAAAAGIRGTSFFTEVNPFSGTTYFCTCNGAIDLSDATGTKTLQPSNAHHGAYDFIKDKDGVRTVVAGLADHTDKDMEDLAKKIGVSIDWTVVDR